jgi:hypothetical protein
MNFWAMAIIARHLFGASSSAGDEWRWATGARVGGAGAGARGGGRHPRRAARVELIDALGGLAQLLALLLGEIFELVNFDREASRGSRRPRRRCTP